jgi:hypothetical protein
LLFGEMMLQWADTDLTVIAALCRGRRRSNSLRPAPSATPQTRE